MTVSHQDVPDKPGKSPSDQERGMKRIMSILKPKHHSRSLFSISLFSFPSSNQLLRQHHHHHHNHHFPHHLHHDLHRCGCWCSVAIPFHCLVTCCFSPILSSKQADPHAYIPTSASKRLKKHASPIPTQACSSLSALACES